MGTRSSHFQHQSQTSILKEQLPRHSGDCTVAFSIQTRLPTLSLLPSSMLVYLRCTVLSLERRFRVSTRARTAIAIPVLGLCELPKASQAFSLTLTEEIKPLVLSYRPRYSAISIAASPSPLRWPPTGTHTCGRPLETGRETSSSCMPT